jgi:hypothetical protein
LGPSSSGSAAGASAFLEEVVDLVDLFEAATDGALFEAATEGALFEAATEGAFFEAAATVGAGTGVRVMGAADW